MESMPHVKQQEVVTVFLTENILDIIMFTVPLRLVTLNHMKLTAMIDTIERYSNDNLDLSINTDQPYIAFYRNISTESGSSSEEEESILSGIGGIGGNDTLSSLIGVFGLGILYTFLMTMMIGIIELSGDGVECCCIFDWGYDIRAMII
ncbi:hypothetical protein EDC94DRAFT_668776 [Helicostylum pulchrum]|nr:hypothetical protein EDC94DRAFT_668776 [Helicostylum pulchrum]